MVTTVSRLGVAQCRQIPVDGAYVAGPDGRKRARRPVRARVPAAL